MPTKTLENKNFRVDVHEYGDVIIHPQFGKLTIIIEMNAAGITISLEGAEGRVFANLSQMFIKHDPFSAVEVQLRQAGQSIHS